jgi:hypothetical protein
VDGQAFEFGLLGGWYGYKESQFLHGVFFEIAYRVRDFRSVDWKFPSNTSTAPGGSTVPPGWPRGIDLSAVTLSVGYQLSLPKEKDKEEKGKEKPKAQAKAP